MYMRSREDQKKDEEEKRELQDTAAAFGLYFKAIENASSPAEAEQMMERFKPRIIELQDKNPKMAQAMMEIFPEGYAELKKKSFIAANGPMPQLPQDFDSNPMEYVQAFVNQKRYMQKMGMKVAGDSTSIAGYTQFNENYGVLVAEDGRFEMVSPAVLNADPIMKERAAAAGTSVGEILSNGGFGQWSQQSIHIGDSVMMVRTRENLINGKYQIEQHELGPRPGAGDGAGKGGGAEKKINRPAQNVINGIASIVNGKKPDDPEERMIYDRLEFLGSKYKKNTAMYAEQVNTMLRAHDPNFTYLIKSLDENVPAKRRYMGFGAMSLGDNAYIQFVPGDMQYVETLDGQEVEFIIDRVGGMIHTGAGERLQGDPDEWIDTVQRSTAKELGLVREPEPEQSEAPRETKPTEQLLSILPEDAKDYELQQINQNGQMVPYLFYNTGTGGREMQKLTPEQFELFRKHLKEGTAADFGSMLSFMKELWKKMHYTTKIREE